MAEPTPRQAQEAVLVGAVEEDLRDGQADDLRGADPRWPSRASSFGQEIISEHVKSGEKGVEVGRHVASLVSVALATPDFGAHRSDHPHPPLNSESTI